MRPVAILVVEWIAGGGLSGVPETLLGHRRRYQRCVESGLAGTRPAQRRLGHPVASAYSSLRRMFSSPAPPFGVRASRKEANGATNGSGAVTV